MSVINMRPPKKLLFTTLESDITPKDAVLELIDTFVEWYRYYKIRGEVQGKRNIKIRICEERFIIESDYPGPPKDMVHNLLRFGEKVDKGCISIGGYGIGTKRAIFRMGQDVCLESYDSHEYYSVHIDKNWIENENEWDLPLKEEPFKGNPFDRILISSFYPEIRAKFKSKAFKTELTQKVKDNYTFFIEKDVDIKICEELVKPYDFKFIFKEDKEYQIKPYHKKFILNGVSAEIFAGFTKWGENDPYGWYVFGNDRLIVQNDVSNRTGFNSTKNIIYQHEDNIFLGLLFFRSYLFNLEQKYSALFSKGKVNEELRKMFSHNAISLSDEAMCDMKDSTHWQIEDRYTTYKTEEVGGCIHIYTDPINLPWKSSKDDIREDLRIYRQVRDKMQVITAIFIRYLRSCEKISKKRGIDIIKSILENVDDKKDIKKMSEIEVEQDESLPPQEWAEGYDITAGVPRLSRIQFWKPLELVIRIKERLGNANMSNEEMGEAIFSYYQKREGINE